MEIRFMFNFFKSILLIIYPKTPKDREEKIKVQINL